MSRSATNFLLLALSADCRGYKQPAEGNTPLFLLGIMPDTDNQHAERYLLLNCLVQVYIHHFSCLSHSLWVDDLILHNFVKNPRDIERIHHFTLPCQILAMYKQVVRYAGYPENQDTCKRRWIVGLTHSILWMCPCTLQEPNTVLVKQCRRFGENKGERSGQGW